MNTQSQDEQIPSKRKIVFQEKPLQQLSKYSKWGVVRKAQKFSTQIVDNKVAQRNSQDSRSSRSPFKSPQKSQEKSPKKSPEKSPERQKSPEKIKQPELLESQVEQIGGVLAKPNQSFLNNILLIRKFFNKSAQVRPIRDPSLTPDQIRGKFKRAHTILRSIFTLNQISEQIIVYGTSSNLFDLSSRDRPAIKRYLFPLLYQDADEFKFEASSLQFPLIHPKGTIRHLWNPILAIVMIYTATLLPFRLGFVFDNDNEQGWIIFDIIVDFIFGIDFIINACSTYYDEEGKLVRSRSDVFVKYFKTWFIIDFISCLPMEIISQAAFASDVSSSHFHLIQLAKITRLFRIIQLTKVVKFVRYLNQKDLLNFFNLNAGIMRLISFGFTVTLQVHLMACLWNFLAVAQVDDPNNWAVQAGLQNQTTSSRYIACVYFALAGLTTVGYGDIHACTTMEMIVVIFWMMLGVAFYSVTIGILTSVLKNMDLKSNTVQRKVAIMNEFCREMRIGKELKTKLKKVLEYNAEKQCFTWIDYDNIFEDLPIALRHEIIYNIHNCVISDMQFFKISENRMFALSIVPYLKPRTQIEGEYLWLKNTTPDGIYLLVTGRVIYLEEFTFINEGINHVKLVGFKSMINGSFFGEIELIFCRKREFYVQCESTCEFYFLDRETFDQKVSKEFPNMYKRLRLISEERMRRNAKVIDEMSEIIGKLNMHNSGKSSSSEKKIDNKDYTKHDISLGFIMKDSVNVPNYQHFKTFETTIPDEQPQIENESFMRLSQKIQHQSEKIDVLIQFIEKLLTEKLEKINFLLEEIGEE